VEVAGRQRTSEIDVVIKTSSGEVVFTRTRVYPIAFEGAPFASGVPTVRKLDAGAGGRQEGNASGEPCVRLGATHGL
jgi:hypothetical protein